MRTSSFIDHSIAYSGNSQAFQKEHIKSLPASSAPLPRLTQKGNIAHMSTGMTQPTLTIVKLTPEELSSGKLSSHTLQSALEALHQDGILALENAVNTTHLDKLNERMTPEAKSLYSNANTHRNFGQATGNIQQEPVVEQDYIFSDIIANPWATSIIEHMIGPTPQLRFYSANTAFKAMGRQPPHVDVDFPMPRMPFGYCININLIGTSPENGATEFWLGSHTDTDEFVFDREVDDLRIRAELVEQRREIRPPIQPSLPKGSLIIRDLRLWHAGMPNRTDEPRVMLVSIQFPSWYRSEQRLVLPRALEGKIDFGRTVPYVNWVGEGYDYLQGAHDHDLTLKP